MDDPGRSRTTHFPDHFSLHGRIENANPTPPHTTRKVLSGRLVRSVIGVALFVRLQRLLGCFLRHGYCVARMGMTLNHKGLFGGYIIDVGEILREQRSMGW